MGRLGMTEILLIGIVFIVVPVITHIIAYRYGKAVGRNELTEELRELERKNK